MRTYNNSWTTLKVRPNSGKTIGTNVNGEWQVAITEEHVNLLNDLVALSKIKTIDVTSAIENVCKLIKEQLPTKQQYLESFGLSYLEEPKKEKKEKAAKSTQSQEEINPELLKENHLVKYLNDNNMKLTELEVLCLKEMLGQGSFYEESFSGNDEDWNGSAFIGWEITEKEVKGCRGAIASLQKKGILDIGTDDTNGRPTQCYWIKHILDFKKDSKYDNDLDIPAQFIKKSRAR